MVQQVELAVGVFQIERDLPAGPRRGAADLGPLELDFVGISMRTRWMSPVAGLLMGWPIDSRTPGMLTFAVRASMSTSNAMGA